MTWAYMLKWVAAYFGVGLVLATISACVSKLIGPRNRHLGETVIMLCLVLLFLWPLMVIVLPIAFVSWIADKIEDTEWWKRLPEWDELYPFEWLVCWPVKLYELWRERHERDSDSGMQKRRK